MSGCLPVSRLLLKLDLSGARPRLLICIYQHPASPLKFISNATSSLKPPVSPVRCTLISQCSWSSFLVTFLIRDLRLMHHGYDPQQPYLGLFGGDVVEEQFAYRRYLLNSLIRLDNHTPVYMSLLEIHAQVDHHKDDLNTNNMEMC